uniref:CMRF35-like molecule 5 n=1 Tax=Astyanax mexicanus TaxID=7994 RepID=A0A3B1J828_ASTMX
MGLAVQTKTVAVFTGTEGGSVDINCRYIDSYQWSHHYFCRAPCSNSDVLIESQKADIPVSKGRYSILNTVTARRVSVTIKNLRLTDSGVYYCGVDKWGSDTLTKVEISVKKAQVNLSTTSQTTGSTDTSTTTNELSTTAKPTWSSAHKIHSKYKSTSSQTPPSTSSDSSAFHGSKAELAVFGVLFGVVCANMVFLLLFLYKTSAPPSCPPVI